MSETVKVKDDYGYEIEIPWTPALGYLEAEATRLRGLLRRVDKLMPICLICHGHLTWIGDEEPANPGHAEGCEWAAEVGE